jgi:hypothetical protein
LTFALAGIGPVGLADQENPARDLVPGMVQGEAI